MKLYRDESSNPKHNAQRNLMGRTHYVDEDTLRWHKSRILAARVVDHGLLFAITTSDALDMDNTKRGYRYVIFDVFGNVLDRPDLSHAFKTRAQCDKAMWQSINSIDTHKITYDAIASAERNHASEIRFLRDALSNLRIKAA